LLGEGDLVLLVEQGFVAHRAEQSLHLPLLPGDVDGLESGEAGEIAAAAGVIGARLLEDMAQRAAWGYAWRDEPLYRMAAALEGAYILRLAWPVHRREALRPAAVRVLVDDSV